MRGMTHHSRQARLRGGSERGAAASMVAVLLMGGVLLGFGALSIDVGSLMWERRQLQNGADAAVLALAQACIEDASACSGTANAALLEDLNDANNFKDQAGGFNDAVGALGVCGRAVPGLPACPSSPALANCPALPANLAADSAIPYVEVHTKTLEADGTAILPTWLAHTLVSGNTGSTIGACARAAFGSAGGPTSLPITFSTCEWKLNTNNGNDYYDVQPETGTKPGYFDSPATPSWPANPSKEIRIVLQDPPQRRESGSCSL